MNLHNYFWYFQSAIPPRICDLIVQHGKSIKKEQAITGGYGRNRNFETQPLTKKEIKNIKDKRDSNVCWFNDAWVYREIQPYIQIANNNAGWKFEWNYSESCQFTIYKKGQYYGWHSDSWYKPYDNEQDKNTFGKIRKLSVTVTLSDPKEYKGGELEFDFRQYDPDKPRKIRTCTEILPKGSVVVFPSFVWHRVKPITKGIRHSLVLWSLGYPFK